MSNKLADKIEAARAETSSGPVVITDALAVEIMAALKVQNKGVWAPKIGDRVWVAPHCPDSELWNREALYFAGMVSEGARVNVSLAEEWPVAKLGLTDGFYIGQSGVGDDILPSPPSGGAS